MTPIHLTPRDVIDPEEAAEPDDPKRLYTPENLPPDADQRVAEYCEPKPTGPPKERFPGGAISPGGFWHYISPLGKLPHEYEWCPRLFADEDLNAWPAVREAIVERQAYDDYRDALTDVMVPLDRYDWEASAAQSTAALLNMIQGEGGDGA